MAQLRSITQKPVVLCMFWGYMNNLITETNKPFIGEQSDKNTLWMRLKLPVAFKGWHMTANLERKSKALLGMFGPLEWQ